MNHFTMPNLPNINIQVHCIYRQLLSLQEGRYAIYKKHQVCYTFWNFNFKLRLQQKPKRGIYEKLFKN
ncbi:MAG: hypothetical protein ACD_17C00369G0002 [uncultured bacterium]|nr:MAG: hypothetical protein ACD_17C00369G0002 [uncultured bacterium]OGN56515.1 MAG: hypothetical protein A2796_07195 [Chlamydiae bacterium RIFCSPHIGHO2_01_FULL_44_39]OGN56914.1 MAG: hypothetical protein A3C42_00365 [Chlamydiae bacterium RIFCSPHIGHO2_02_FULL_45_9]OGN61019.1 MAG: hypothetical protein A3D96_02845 [Chlamydiae bacterium RIFCSPHIGHO2_12_FULL_44_59]OGN66795.1 MAG: hypothetical protein A2978_00330 [Chlamydiae bacterium RIFCSPLOWO2_01_FULL_44_52]OGN69989.1 MAG: hypothetical protein A3